MKIKYSLSNMDTKLVNKYIEEINEEDILNKLDKLVDKKIKSIKNYSGNVLKMKILNYFSNLGYSREDIEKVLSNKSIKNDNGIKEYTKLYNKYSKKYEGYELEKVIANKLYSKGYDINEIKKDII